MIIDPEILTALALVLNNTATDKEKETVDGWLAESEKNKRAFEQLIKISSQKVVEEEAEEARERIFSVLQKRMAPVILKPVRHVGKYIAAASIFLAVLLIGFNLMRETREKETMAQIQTQTSYGSINIITLMDGTVVKLNAGSELSYPAYFNGDSRHVSLKGEAYFEVAKDKKHPFVVQVNNLEIEVLGTHFNVKSYEDDEEIVTTLLEGAVQVSKKEANGKKEESVLLKPNQQLIFNKVNDSLTLREVDSERYVLWKDGQYYFENEKFSDILKELERGFGVDITVEFSDLNKQVFSGAFNKTENLEQILNTFKKHRDFDYKRAGNGIIIFKKERQ